MFVDPFSRRTRSRGRRGGNMDTGCEACGRRCAASESVEEAGALGGIALVAGAFGALMGPAGLAVAGAFVAGRSGAGELIGALAGFGAGCALVACLLSLRRRNARGSGARG